MKDEELAELMQQNDQKKQSTEIQPYDVHFTDRPPKDLLSDEDGLAEFNQDIKRKLPRWLGVYFVVKAPKQDPHFQLMINFDEVKFGDEFLKHNILKSFPALISGATYDVDKAIWRVLGKGENIAVIESRTTALLKLWGVYENRFVSDARLYIIRQMFDESFGKKSPFDESNPALVVFQNGTYNMETNLMQPNRADDYILNSHAYNVDPNDDKAPETDKLINKMIGDADTFFKEFIGYMFYRSHTPFQKIMFLHGEGGEGKSTLLNHIQRNVIGENNISAVEPRELGKTSDARFSKVEFYGKEANMVADIERGYLENTAFLKQLSGGDRVSGEYKGLQKFYFNNYAKLLFSANSLPTFSDLTTGFKDRLVTIDLINGDVRDEHPEWWKQFNMNLIKQESPAFAMECIQLFRIALKKRKLTITESIRASSQAWFDENDHFGQFLTEACEIYRNDERGEVVTDVVAEYKKFCQLNNYSDKTSSQATTKKLKPLGILKSKGRKGWSNSMNIDRYVGLKLTTSFINPHDL